MNLLELRKQMKRKKPKFIRQDAHKKRLKKRWVKPRGLHSKVRLKKAGHPKKVSDGYRTPKKVRGLSKEGLKIIRIHNENELNSIQKEKEGIIISAKVSLKNKISLLKKAKEKNIIILNLNVEEYLKRKENEKKKRDEKKKVKKQKRKEKKEEKKEKKEKLEEKLSDEEKQEKEKKEKDKLLTKRET
jgi:large subunit ribosomal protein L32e